MSFQKSIVTGTGATMTYWKITCTSIANVAEVAVITLSGYLDEASKTARLDCVPRNFRVTGDDYRKYYSEENQTNKHPSDIGYTYIKENDEEFKDAIDLL